VVRPDDEADDADGDHGVGHAEIAEDGFAREGRDHLADDAEARKNEDVNLRMAEEPEQVLEEHGIAAAIGLEEGRAEIAIGKQHGDRARENGQREQQQEHGDEDRPDEERHLVQRHARRAHVEDRGDEVDGAEDRGCARDMDRENGKVHRRSGLAARRQRRIDGQPPAAPLPPGARHETSR